MRDIKAKGKVDWMKTDEIDKFIYGVVNTAVKMLAKDLSTQIPNSENYKNIGGDLTIILAARDYLSSKCNMDDPSGLLQKENQIENENIVKLRALIGNTQTSNKRKATDSLPSRESFTRSRIQ